MQSIRGRIFLVGCPRSGTTLLQSLIAAHPDIASFPESKFFQELIYPGSRRSKLKLASKNARHSFNQFLDDIERHDMSCFLPKSAIFAHQYTKAFVRVLDTLTEHQGKHFWLEKTPSHVQRINYIEKGVEKAKFVHLIRNGADVVASLYETTNKHQKVWSGSRVLESSSQNLDRCIKRWINDVRISCSHMHKPDHLIVKYEQLVEEPQLVLTEICQFLDVEFDEAMLKNHATSAKNLIRKREVWKDSVSKKIHKANSQKFHKFFDESQRQYVLQKLAAINLENLSANTLGQKLTDCQFF